MMRVSFVIAIVLALAVVVFALQNSQPVRVSFLQWSFESSLVVILLVTYLSGALCAFIASIPGYIRSKRQPPAGKP